jgi:hypothetical protein
MRADGRSLKPSSIMVVRDEGEARRTEPVKVVGATSYHHHHHDKPMMSEAMRGRWA